MATVEKASIVFAHGIWADGSCFRKVIPGLQAAGHEVVSTQNGLDTLEGDVAADSSFPGTGNVGRRGLQ